MNQEEAAEALLITPTTLSRWERGTQDIRPVYRARIAQVFGVSGAEVERWLHGTDPVATDLWPLPNFSDLSITATVESAEKFWRGELDLDRRHLLAALPFVPAALNAWLSEWSYGASVVSAASQGAARAVGHSDVVRVTEMWRTLSQIDHLYGSRIARPAVVDYMNTEVTPLLRGTYDDKVGAELLAAAAGMTSFLGWTAFDLANHGQAQHYYGQALKFAKIADDPLTGAHVLTAMTRQAIHLGQSDYAAMLGRATVESARQGGATPRVMALMLAREAWTTALRARPSRTRDRHSAKRVQRLIGEAEHAYAQGPSDADPYWIRHYDEPELRAELGWARLHLGAHDQAIADSEHAVHEFLVARPRSAQLNRVTVANAYLDKQEVEQAVAVIRAVPAANTQASPRLMESIRQFDKRLSPYEKNVQVREFRAYLDQQLAS